jgi:hypothetical protein
MMSHANFSASGYLGELVQRIQPTQFTPCALRSETPHAVWRALLRSPVIVWRSHLCGLQAILASNSRICRVLNAT